jgi:membrane dipeptidase
LNCSTLGRRAFLAGLGLTLIVNRASGAETTPLADAHSHLFFNFRDRIPIRERMLRNRVELIALHVVPDAPFLSRDAVGRVTQSQPNAPGEIYANFRRMTSNIRGRLAIEDLPMLTSKADLANLSPATPRVLLSVEGADFLEDQFERLQEAFDLGVRQIGVGHFVASRLVDLRTEPPKHGGLTERGRTFIERCNALGIIVDNSHSTDEAIEQAVSVSRKPMIYSHGSIGRFRSNHQSPGDSVMAISRSTARKLADRGGLIGIWGHRNTYKTIEQYGDAIVRFIDWVGADHIAIGSDIGGLGTPSDPVAFDLLRRDYGELRRVLMHIQKAGVSSGDLEKIAHRNYRRLVGEVLPA